MPQEFMSQLSQFGMNFMKKSLDLDELATDSHNLQGSSIFKATSTNKQTAGELSFNEDASERPLKSQVQLMDKLKEQSKNDQQLDIMDFYPTEKEKKQPKIEVDNESSEMSQLKKSALFSNKKQERGSRWLDQAQEA